jgi:hypothetical protein
MENRKKLRTGAAYYGNRMISRAMTDMRGMARADLDIVVHMLTHNDMERDRILAENRKKYMK